GELGEHTPAFQREIAARQGRTPAQRLPQPLTQAPRPEKSALDQHFATLLGERPPRRDEDDPAVRVRGTALRRTGHLDRPAGEEGGQQREPVEAVGGRDAHGRDTTASTSSPRARTTSASSDRVCTIA